jgi:hypothetical protein
MAERKKSPLEKDLGQKKKSPYTEVNNRMDERKKSSIEKEKIHEVKKRMHKQKASIEKTK